MPLNKLDSCLSTLIGYQLLLVIVVTTLTILNTTADNLGGQSEVGGRQSVRSDDDDDDDNNDGKTWKIIGIVVGIVCFAIILILIYVCVVIRRRRQKNGQKWFWTRSTEIKTRRNQQSTGQSQQIVTGSLTRASAPQVNNQIEDHPSPPSFNPNFVPYDGSYIFTDNERPPPYDFREISIHPSAPPETLQFRNENELGRQRSVQTITEL